MYFNDIRWKHKEMSMICCCSKAMLEVLFGVHDYTYVIHCGLVVISAKSEVLGMFCRKRSAWKGQ